MSKNVKIANTHYNDVPSITVPLQTSGTASFYDVSDTTATASDVASGKYFYTAAGVLTQGTSSGGGGTSKNAQIWSGFGTVQSTTYTAVANPNSQATMTITVAKAGTYDVYWCGYRSSNSGTWGSRLYINGSGYGSNITTFDQYLTSVQVVHLSGVALNADDVLTVRARSRGSSYTFYIYDLVIIEQ